MKTPLNNINVYLILLLIVTGGTYTFGLAWSNFSITTPFIKLTDSLFIFIYLLIIGTFYYKNKIKYIKSPIRYYYFFVLLFIFEFIKNLFFSESSLPDIISGIKYFYMLFLLFPLVQLIKTNTHVKVFINGIIVLGVINGLFYYFQFITGIDLPASSGVFYDGIYRINQPGFNVIIISFYLVLASLITDSKPQRWTSLVLLLFFSSIFIISLSRGLLLGVFSGILLILRWNLVKNASYTIIYSLILFVGLFIVGIFLTVQFNFNFSSLSSRMQDGVQDVSEQEGAYSVREKMILEKLDYMLQNHPILGVGFLYKSAETDDLGHILKDSYNDPLTLNNDSTYQNITIVTGYTGLLLWLLILYNIFKTGKKIFMATKNPEIKHIALALIGLPFFALIHGLSSSYFNAPGLTFLAIIAALSFWIQKLAQYKINENSNFKPFNNAHREVL